jgi:small subunit ribosomal protein S24e
LSFPSLRAGLDHHDPGSSCAARIYLLAYPEPESSFSPPRWSAQSSPDARPQTDSPQADNSAPITLRTRKFITNRLLARRQFVIDVLHPSRPNVSKADLSEKLAALYKTDKNRVVTFGFRTQFGGGRSTGFALIYDDEASQKKFEPKYRLVRVRAFGGSTVPMLIAF